jgi:hypothetical protein
MVNVIWEDHINRCNYGTIVSAAQQEKERFEMSEGSAAATIADVRSAIEALELAAQKDQKLEGLMAKKLAMAIDYLTIKDGVTKDLNQAYTNGEKWWAVNYANDEKDGCTKANKIEKIKARVLASDVWVKHHGNSKTKDKAEAWLAEKFK